MAKLAVGRSTVTWVALGVGIGLSVLAALSVGRWQAASQQNRFQRQIENLTTALQRSLNRYTDLLAFLSDYYRVNEGQVSRQEFDSFVARSLQRYSGIQALEWAPLVRQSERLTFEQGVQAEGYPSFEITELADNGQLVRALTRPYYIPVNYIAPVQNNELAFGFDLNSDPVRTAAIQMARDQGDITATSPIRLVQEFQDQFGFLVVLPRYQTGDIPVDEQTRQDQFEGFLLGVFRVSDVVEESLQDLEADVDFALHDLGDEPRFLGRYDSTQRTVMTNLADAVGPSGRSPLCPLPADCTRTLTVGNRQWQITFFPARTYPIGVPYSVLITLLVGIVLTGSLVSFLRSLNQELVGAKTLSNLKLRFFSTASHELRTPLSTIVLSAESLQFHQDDWTEEQKRASIQRIYLTAKGMSQQITDLLTLTRAEVGKLEFNPELIDIDPFVCQVIADIDDRSHPRIVLSRSELPIRAFWDKKLVRSLLSNLLSNALKYSPDNSRVAVAVHCTAQTATVTVQDQGRGIPAAEQQQVRDVFHRGSNVGEIPGTGLGLAIVDTCVALHQGDWDINSREGQGTTVRVRLPLEPLE